MFMDVFRYKNVAPGFKNSSIRYFFKVGAQPNSTRFRYVVFFFALATMFFSKIEFCALFRHILFLRSAFVEGVVFKKYNIDRTMIAPTTLTILARY